jgi:NTE family protein
MNNNNKIRKKVALILSGSGIRGFASIALKELFEKNDWPVDLIIGSSGGGVTAALWASHQSSKQMLKISQHLASSQANNAADLATFFTFFHHPFGVVKKSHALLKSKPIIEVYRNIWSDLKIEELSTRLILGATNVVTGQFSSITKGELASAVYASRATLPFYPAIELNGEWLVDGAFSQPLPISLAVEEDADIIIVMNCEMASPEKPDNFLAFYANFVAQASSVAHRAEYPLIIDFHQGDIEFITVHADNLRSAVNWEEINKIMTHARQTVKNHETTLNALFNSISIL